MRIGIVAPEFPPDIGGVETYSFEFARELVRRGHDVSVFTVSHPQGEIHVPGLRVLPALKVNRKLDSALLKHYRMDLWHVMNAAYGWLALEHEPVTVSVHGNDFLSPYFLVEQPSLYRCAGLWRLESRSGALHRWLARSATRRLMQNALPRARHIMANSLYTETALLKLFPLCRGKTSVGLVGVSEDFFRVERPSRDVASPPRLITVCRLAEKRKNVERVIEALARIRHHDFLYTIVGDGPLRPRLQEKARELGIGERVQFTGFIDDRSLKERLAASDLFILASSVLRGSHEGFGIAYLEANACGTPVLAARLGGAVEAVAEGVSGMFVDEPSVGALSAALERYLSGKIRFDRDACRAFARRFTWSRVVDHAFDRIAAEVQPAGDPVPVS